MMIWLCNLYFQLSFIVLIQITLCEWSVIKYFWSSTINALKNIFVLCWVDMSSSVPFVYFLVYQIAHTIHILQNNDVGWKRAMGFPGKHNCKLAHSASAALLKLCPHSLLFFIFSKNVKTQIRLNCYCWGKSSMVEGPFSKWF